ncbi:YHS domain-containing (seleno)protein [Paracoccus onubensis]|uniref:YHS domain-containing (seleno)protein n=1 Tax=Paracoccus onubensis TaxID=1675788 RepID=UPI00273063D9|nr:YHS domain-containing (seleno)protein [Paracoccus onubensis]MDP0929162.1 YHS domain-containing (seleno)protein [Paracoccus onubensis]
MKLFAPAISMLTAFASPLAAQDWAVGGYDPVGFVSGRPAPGRSDISTLWKGQFWHFVSEDNRTRFESDPGQFAPAFDGLCPVSLAQGEELRGDPRFFAVIGDTLYLTRSDADLRRLQQAPDEILRQAKEIWAARN